MFATKNLTEAHTPAQAHAADRLTQGGYAITFLDAGHGQRSLLAAHPDEMAPLVAEATLGASLAPHLHWVLIRWQDGRFYDAEVNYDMGGGGMYRSIRAALDEVLW